MMQDQEIFSFFEVRNVPQELRTETQTLLVKNVDYYQKAQRLDVFVSADHMIDSPGLTEAEKLIADQAFPSHDILVRIIPRFMLNPVPTALEILEQYKDNIAWELEHKKKDIPVRMLYKGSYAEETSKGIVLRTKDKFMAEIAGQKLIDYLKEILLMRFGLDTCVFLEVCEDPEFIQAQLFNHEQERLRILNEYRTAVPTGQKADTAKTTPKKPESLLLYGKNTDGAITRLDELDDIKGNIVVRGRILSSEVRKTKQEEKKLLILSLTDDTDSIAAKLFLKAEIADKLSAQLQEGTCVKIKGVAGFDPYSQERSITTVFGISTIEEFAVKRNDSANRKRVELHCHTKSSDMDGVSDVRDIVKAAYDWGMPAVAITDHGVVHSFPDANHILKKNGVRVISIKENISDGPEGIILESMLEGYAEYYSAELAQKIRRGQQENAIKCMNNGGNVPLGYYVNKTTGKLDIDPETAPYVRELFSRYAAGERLTVLQAEMEERGIRSKRGNAYTVSVLSNLLKNRKYIGEYKYGSVVTPGGIPAIIEKDLFERVQMRMTANKRAPARAKANEEYLLTTKLFCGDCGRLMAGESGRGHKGVVYQYYKCGGAKRKLGCKKKAVRKQWIEDVVVKLTVSQVLTDTAIDRIANAIVVMQEQEDTVTPVLKQQLQQCEAEIRNVMKAIRQGIITDTTKECLEDLESQRESLRGSIAQLQLERRKFSKEEIVDWISRYRDGNINDPEYRREIIDTFVNSVYVYDDKLILTYNYKDGSQTLTLQEVEAALSSDLTGMCPPYKSRWQQSAGLF